MTKPSRANVLLGLTVLIFIILVTYSRSLNNGYVWDDNIYITDESLATLDGLERIWIDPTSTGHLYYPITHTTFWIEHQIWWLNPFVSHTINVFMHVVNAVLVWAVLSYLRVPGAWAAAVIFGVHPVHVESVAWIAQRKNL